MSSSVVTIPQAIDLALEQHRTGNLAEAEAIYRQVLAVAPRNPGALHLLGVLLHKKGEKETGTALVRSAIAADPTQPTFHDNLGVLLREGGSLNEAAASHQEAIRLQPDWMTAYFNLCETLILAARLKDAGTVCLAAIDLEPENARLYDVLGGIRRKEGRFDESIQAYRKALQLEPSHFGIYNNLGNVLQECEKLDDSMAAFRKSLEINPNFPHAYLNLANLERERGYIGEAIRGYRRAMELDPSDPRFHSNLVYVMHFDPASSAEALAEELRRWNEKFVRPLYPMRRPHSNSREPHRRLKVGYISADFRNHVIGRNLIPFFQHHDHGQFEIFCYSNVLKPDQITERFTGYADHWRLVNGLSAETVASMVREDGIDILVDLTLHMSENSLLVFARKPAPVQVTFAGYPSTTGLETIDYRITDPHLDPPGGRHFYSSEEPMRLQHSFWCYDPIDCQPELTPLPALKSRSITFGCLNTFAKVTREALALWSRILNAVPGSRLFLLSAQGSHRQEILAFLKARGIKPVRVEFREPCPRPEYLEIYHRLDIALDTFPYNGHTTSLDTLFMGVPVVTLEGATPVSRGGVSMLKNIGLSDLIARSEDEYVDIAVRLSSDPKRLSELRSTLRGRMQASPLMDASQFTKDIENAFRKMWERWCESPA